jgi:uracil-DNA glycosylase
MIERKVNDFESWRPAARELIARGVPPLEIRWRDDCDLQQSLPLGDDTDSNVTAPLATKPSASRVTTQSAGFRVPKEFVELARLVACHRDQRRWHLLYETLWRIVHGERKLLQIEVDESIHTLRLFEKAVRSDIHKMHAFVRFEKRTLDHGAEYLAYYRPDFGIVHLAVPFFVKRFHKMNWTILGPDETATWDGRQLTFLPGVTLPHAVDGDELKLLWQTYYASTFNPARLNVRTMRREMPQRFWPLLPEVEDVQRLIARAPGRTEQLIRDGAAVDAAPRSASQFLPFSRDLTSLAEAARVCQGCSLYASATQTVFGEGPPNARVVFVGEQPGDQEDIAGRPFVGPAGQIFDELLAEAGIDRQQTYVTNTVKHFKWVPRGKRRIHSKPSAREVYACRPWLEAELETIRPPVLVLLGATAAQAILGPQFRIQRERGQIRRSPWSNCTIATYHPSAILRASAAAHALQIREALLADLKLAAAHIPTSFEA